MHSHCFYDITGEQRQQAKEGTTPPLPRTMGALFTHFGLTKLVASIADSPALERASMKRT